MLALRSPFVLAAAPLLLVCQALAQANTVNGLDGQLYDISTTTVWGRQGPQHPNGQVAISVANFICNPGSVDIPWRAAMDENHPIFAFLFTRLSDDRLVQISNRSFCKHAFISVNGNHGPCAPCFDPQNGTVMGVGCADIYGASTNASRFWLGPADEVNPWLGTWNSVGSYFDRGDPDVGPPFNSDGIRSLTETMTTVWMMGQTKNRVLLSESELVVPGAQFHYMVQLIHQGEHVSKRDNNILSRELDMFWNGVAWLENDQGPAMSGTVLHRWPGATVTLGGNGQDDGRIAVACKVTGPTDGKWHYEYAIHNIDNHRGLASFRLPVCPQATIENLGFRDIDQDSLNDWTASVSGNEILWSAPANNALRWNTLFNFWFDSDAAPNSANADFDQALLGPGAASFQVVTDGPVDLPHIDLGPGCGSATYTLRGNGLPVSPNPNYQIRLEAPPMTSALVFYSFAVNNTIVAPGCIQYLDGTAPPFFHFATTDATGLVDMPLSIPPGLNPGTIYFQAAVAQANGPVFEGFGLSNGLAVRMGQHGCQ
ncbi:MAG: hypothetical protein VYE77_02180 [Planctomycetota bacterium]|nr:hypothetical protein [Planctomycetota bacterium]